MSVGAEPVGAAPVAASRVPLDSSDTPPDESADDRTERSWDCLDDQRDRMIGAMTTLFGWLNGGVYLLIFRAWVTGIR